MELQRNAVRDRYAEDKFIMKVELKIGYYI